MVILIGKNRWRLVNLIREISWRLVNLISWMLVMIRQIRNDITKCRVTRVSS